MKYLFGTLSLFVLIISINSCSYDDGDLNYPTSSNDTLILNTDDTTTVSFANDIRPILINYCYGIGNQHCHVTNSNQGSNGDYTSYSGLKAKVDNGTLQIRAINAGGGMPPSYSTGPLPLAAIDKNKLQRWINQGARDN